MNPPTKEPLRAQYSQQQFSNAQTKLEALLDDITAAAHIVNVCALNLQSARAGQRRCRIWLAIGMCSGMALAILAGQYWPL